ncbi:Transcription factor ILR3 Basic helix-loop-helix protein [Vigna angularis]|uniref:Transcription factor ILR3 Basic helix-loop-helix protein n=2 Tax=Phaseolus angularis TaxID=3914 RepID=A0A8T0K986_PHAAN|nr:transcription factor ILR3 [Vigna angularis]KAG2396171.1 Transcription factor ILR3 Basic helix-loop-helix protein [Vigna angularis]
MSNSDWVLDYDYLDSISFPTLHPPNFSWSSSSPPPTFSADVDDPLGISDGFKENGSKKRLRSPGSKACKEKMRRDRLNDRFLELGSVLDPARPLKMEKAVILSDAVRTVSQLREEAQKLRESIKNLQGKINELKAEKNELREEKQQLKAEKDNLEQKIEAFKLQPSFLSAVPAPGQVVGRKLVPFMGYPGVAMWQFLPPAAVDTSQDHVLRPPVA